MVLTQPQLAAIKAWVIANNNSLFDQSSVNLLNAIASPTFNAYRTEVAMSEIMLNGFDWTRVDNLSVGKARIWDWLVNADPVNQAINPSKSNIRAGINAVWIGTAPDLAVRAAVYLHCFRPATVAEKLLKTAGAGTVCDAAGDGPATLGFEGNVTLQDVINSESQG